MVRKPAPTKAHEPKPDRFSNLPDLLDRIVDAAPDCLHLSDDEFAKLTAYLKTHLPAGVNVSFGRRARPVDPAETARLAREDARWKALYCTHAYNKELRAAEPSRGQGDEKADADRLPAADTDPFRPLAWFQNTLGIPEEAVRSIWRRKDSPVRRRQCKGRGKSKHEYSLRDVARARPCDESAICAQIERLASPGEPASNRLVTG